MYKNGSEVAIAPSFGGKAGVKVTKPDGTIIEVSSDTEKVGSAAISAYKMNLMLDAAQPILDGTGSLLKDAIK